jgi:hypothetical protein
LKTKLGISGFPYGYDNQTNGYPKPLHANSATSLILSNFAHSFIDAADLYHLEQD